ncbi:MAG TPA: hypothetical protein VND93_08325 [Myxococcales bacterium]|nr:hypothetical protein [Myxococcales bacterium]
MRQFLAAVTIASGLLAGCGRPDLASADPDPTDELAQPYEPLTATDVDVAPECQGVITFANNASFATLDLYLPSDLASNIVGARSVTPFTNVASLSAVYGMGPVRLSQTYQGALAEGYVTSSCVGIFDELAVSTDDQAQMVALVNGISSEEMHDILPHAWNGAVNLLAGRPYTTAAGISNTSGIGTVSFRNIRNTATLSKPFEALAAAVNNLHGDGRMARHFDWYHEMWNAEYGYHQAGGTCFGIDPNVVPQGIEIRQNLATPTEVYDTMAWAVSYVDRYHHTIDPTAGLANLQEQAAGRSFFGCNINYAPDPWSGHTISFFVDPLTGFGAFTETWWSE